MSFKGFIAGLSTKRWARFGLLWLAATLVLESFFFSQVLASANYEEVSPGELGSVMLMHALTGLVVAAVISLIGRSWTMGVKLATAAVLASLAVGYNDRFMSFLLLLRAFVPPTLPAGEDTPLLSVVFMLLLVTLVYWLGRGLMRLQRRFAKTIEPRNLAYGVLVIIAVLFFGQALKVTTILAELWPQSHVTAASLGQPTRPAAKDKPDIYYVVLDRYTNNQVLKDQFGYDNSDFTDFLRGQGFTVNEHAMANYPFTDVSISSTLAANYTDKLVAPYKHDSAQSHTLFHNIIHQSPVIKALKAQGYRYYSVGSWYGATSKAPLADVDYPNERSVFLFGHQVKRVSGLESAQFAESPYYSLMKTRFSWWPTRVDELLDEHLPQQQLKTLNKLAGSKDQGGRFIMAHLLVTHPPYLFNADGSISAYQDSSNTGKTPKQKYVDTVRFINDQMKTIVTKAVDNSGGKAVFMFSADEGPFPTDVYPDETSDVDYPSGSGSMDGWPKSWTELKFGILQAARIPQATEADLDHLSSVNLFRIVLNSYQGYNLNYLPQCYFAVGKNSEYVRRDYTPRLTGQTDSECTNLLSAR